MTEIISARCDTLQKVTGYKMNKLIAVAVFIAGISAIPQPLSNQDVDFQTERFVTDIIAGAIEDLSYDIKDAGLDPLEIRLEPSYLALPVPVIFNAEGLLEELKVVGLSDIVIEHINFSLLNLRVDIVLSLPRIQATIKRAEGKIVLFGSEIGASVSGSLSINNIRIPAVLNVFLGVAGIRIMNADIDARISEIRSDLNIFLLGNDYSDNINTFLGQTIPRNLDLFHDEVNELLEMYAPDLINGIIFS